MPQEVVNFGEGGHEHERPASSAHGNTEPEHDWHANALAHHSNLNDPTAAQKAALAGTSGAPGDTNRYVTDADPRLAGGGAPTDATYLVTAAHAGLAAEVVVGATPGGELGGTWAAPSVDPNHAGGTHHDQDHAARHAAGAADPLMDETAPAAQAFGDSGAPGAAAVAAKRDHKHPMPANPVTAHEAAGDPHTQYATNVEFDDHSARHEPGGGDPMAVDAAAATGSLRTLGAGATQAAPGNHGPHGDVAAHEAAGDPHAQYALDSDLTTHAGAADPHTGYQRESEKGAANGYAALGADSLVPQEQLGTGAQDGTKFLRDDGVWATPAGGGGGSAEIKEVEIDMGTGTRLKKFTITDAAVLATHQIVASQSHKAATGRQADENEMDRLQCTALAAAGQFDLWVQSLKGGAHGKFVVNYVVG